MKRLPIVLWAALILLAFYLFFAYGVGPLTGRLTETGPAPLPGSLVQMFVALVITAILVFVSVTDERWRAFVDPILDFVRGGEGESRVRRGARGAALAAFPLLLGYLAWARQTAALEPPADPPAIHFNLPDAYLNVENPLEWTPENIAEGGVLYTRSCAPCHGDAQDGEGPAARALLPKPADFRDTGTIAQLPENYLLWRIKEGGPGLPRGSIEYRSAMPRWEGTLTDQEMWKIIMFEYTNAGVKPARR